MTNRKAPNTQIFRTKSGRLGDNDQARNSHPIIEQRHQATSGMRNIQIASRNAEGGTDRADLQRSTQNARNLRKAQQDLDDTGTLFGERLFGTTPIQTRVPGAYNLENAGQQKLYIEHVPTGFTVTFPAFITSFGDAYNSSWNSDKVYGRMDPIGTFMHTKRAISLSWEVPAESFEHAMRNLLKVNKLISFLYPLYHQTGRDKKVSAAESIGVINQDPLWKVRFGNLVQNAKTGGPLLGFVNGITMDPMVENGFFHGLTPEGKAEYYPKAVRLNFEFVVLHEHSLGFDASIGKRKTVETRVGFEMTKTAVTYRFSDPKLNFGNFPYVTDNFAAAVRSEGATLPTIPPPSINDPNMPAAGSAVDMSQFEHFLWEIQQGNILDFSKVEAAQELNQITEREKWQLWELDQSYGNLRYGNEGDPIAFQVAYAKRTQQAYYEYTRPRPWKYGD
jgi:hypothetical protein